MRGNPSVDNELVVCFPPPLLLIPHFKHGYFKTTDKLVNNCNMCICHEWTWCLGQLFGSSEVLSLEPIWQASLLQLCKPRHIIHEPLNPKRKLNWDLSQSRFGKHKQHDCVQPLCVSCCIVGGHDHWDYHIGIIQYITQVVKRYAPFPPSNWLTCHWLDHVVSL